LPVIIRNDQKKTIYTRGHIAGGGLFRAGKVNMTGQSEQFWWLQQSRWCCYWFFAAYIAAVSPCFSMGRTTAKIGHSLCGIWTPM